MIIDLQKFVTTERPYWTELESTLNQMERDPGLVMALEQLRRFHYLYERAAAGLARVNTFAAEPETRRYLESLVARAYGEIHETRANGGLTLILSDGSGVPVSRSRRSHVEALLPPRFKS